MSADVFYTIGSTHQVCQDYAITDGNSYVILSDGCSSAQDSDWGARLLSKTMQIVMMDLERPFFVNPEHLTEALADAANYIEKLNLVPEALAATLLGAYMDDSYIHSFIYGDGHIIARNRKNGNYHIVSHHYETGAPYYLYYSLDPELKKNYIRSFGHGKLIVEKRIVDEDKCIELVEENQSPVGGYTSYSFKRDEYDLVAVISDGLDSFMQSIKKETSITNKRLGIEEVIREVLDFKTTSGKFVHRRCQKVFREFNNKDIKHTDDFSIGVIFDENGANEGIHYAR